VGIALSASENAEDLADNLETQFQPVTHPSVAAIIDIFYTALRSYLTPAIEPKLTKPEEFRKASKGLKLTKSTDPNGIPNRALK